MAPNNLENEDWRPEEYFARVAARRDMTPEQLRARLRRLVDEVNVRGGHLSFERLRDATRDEAALSEPDLAHLAQCKYCSRFMETVNPGVAEVKRFVDSAEVFADQPLAGPAFARATRASPLPAARTRVWPIPATLAASFLIVCIGIATWQSMKGAKSVPDVLASAVKDCARASGNPKACETYAKAANYQANGEVTKAQELVASGLAQTGVSAPVVRDVQQVLNTSPTSLDQREPAVEKANLAAERAAATNKTPARVWLETARLHMEAGQEPQAYNAVARYLKDSTEPHQAYAFTVGFAQPAGKLDVLIAEQQASLSSTASQDVATANQSAEDAAAAADASATAQAPKQ
jgi:hypothetical protein